MAKWSGGCACGAIKYSCEGEPALMFNCHCRDCQRASGTGYAAFAVFPKTKVSISGAPHYHSKIGGSGKAIERGFCATCGNPLMVTLEVAPAMIALYAGSLNDPAMFKPSMDLFTGSAHHWVAMNDYTTKKTGSLAG